MQLSMKEQMLHILLEHNGEYVSGQKISEQLGCSRTAIWKHISELRKEGYELEAMQRRGYRIIQQPNNIRSHNIHVGLKTEFVGQNIVYHESVSSTQTIAHQLAHEGAEEGTLVAADEQGKGKGRLGRDWHSPKGTGVWMSLILRPKIPPQQAPQLTLLAAVAVVKGIKEAVGLDCEIKWPNDILIHGKKVVGILTELQAEADRIQSVIIGIGINVNVKEFPEELQNKATSLLIEKSGKEINRAALMQRILEQTERIYKQYLKEGFPIIKLLWESYAVSLGKEIKATTINGSFEGYAKGITEEGVLLIEDKEGEIHQIYSADIEISSQT
ncbi:biotin--[acetyl-CoA-carboxylase] ligase [Bacillus taeanensis]|uniref:Bifunctional ligase/repressor BirA n=1 Tax=Bacillus taeanensis TaxID=273032 RepID=A0A366Y1G5_9BACI|nr:biotin--[acetyl-CoA-carboxylase] ligase [Bacillus taeanensis]RBW70254.1 biotin--[acetyl-CoA-carboxylase] ligase [Bacillus taeanensis]